MRADRQTDRQTAPLLIVILRRVAGLPVAKVTNSWSWWREQDCGRWRHLSVSTLLSAPAAAPAASSARRLTSPTISDSVASTSCSRDVAAQTQSARSIHQFNSSFTLHIHVISFDNFCYLVCITNGLLRFVHNGCGALRHRAAPHRNAIKESRSNGFTAVFSCSLNIEVFQCNNRTIRYS